MDSLRSKFEDALSGRYTIERELGGGGMSKTYLSREDALSRRVVIKILSPELLAGVSIERFRREVQLAAQLQHPHIVPVLATGEVDGLPWFSMPYVDGDSLRHRLGLGRLTQSEAVGILRDVARALAFAHDNGVVHRDIKPDNVLLAGGSATVTDFGIAKAITAARTPSEHADSATALTMAGTSMGTPAYMAPEQAVGDPNTDHRADLYSFGVMAYELLAGHTPFQGSSPSKLIAAHVGEQPRTLQDVAPDCPATLSSLVMLCLSKDPDRRPAHAREILRVLDSLSTSGSSLPSASILRGGNIPLQKALGLWTVATTLVAVTAWAATTVIGLPDWVFKGSIAVMLLGLPIIAFAVFAQRVATRTFTATPGRNQTHGTMANIAMSASPHLSWRRIWFGGGLAVGGFAILVAGFMVARAMGVGPMASLQGKGQFGSHETVMIADFASPASDSTLGATVAEALRTDLAQSTTMRVMSRGSIREILNLMRKSVDEPVTFDLAREIATREGAKAVLDGAIQQIGTGYVVSARLVGAVDGAELAMFRTEAQSQEDLLPAIGKLSRQVREKTGESLRSIRRSSELERVTTPSLAALKKYVEGSRLADEQGDQQRGIELLREAVAIDTSFAMAWRKLGVLLSNNGREQSARLEALSAAWRHRDRLTEMERLLTEGIYYSNGPIRDDDRAIEAYMKAIVIDSLSTAALNNAAILYSRKRMYSKAESLYRKVTALPRKFGGAYTNLLQMQVITGKTASLDSTYREFQETLPDHLDLWEGAYMVAVGKGDMMRADSIAKAVAASPKSGRQRRLSNYYASLIAEYRGKLAESRKFQETVSKLINEGTESPAMRLQAALDSAYYDIYYGDMVVGKTRIRNAIERYPPEDVPPEERRWVPLYELALTTGDRELMLRVTNGLRKDAALFTNDTIALNAVIDAGVAFAEERWADAARGLAAASERFVFDDIFSYFYRAQAFRKLDQRDSAIAMFEKVLAIREPSLGYSALFRGIAVKELGELYEAKGDFRKAIDYYGLLVEQWKDADPQLQSVVTDVRRRIDALIRRTG